MSKKYYALGVVIIIIFAFIITIVTGNDSPKKQVAPVSGISASVGDTKKPDMVPVYLYFAVEDLSGLSAETRWIPIEEAAKSTSNLASVIVKELIEGPSKASELSSTVPTESKLLDSVEIDGDKAIVNLNNAFVQNHPGDKINEQLTIYSIVNSLTELKDINSVMFKIEGESREEFVGNFRFDKPFPRTVTLIK